MKKYLLIGAAILVLGALIFASCRKASAAEEFTLSDWLKKVPAVHQCLLYNFSDSEFEYASTVTLVSLWNEKINVDIGYSPSQEAIGAVSVKLIEVKDYIKYPILDLLTLEPLVYAGWNRISLGSGNSKAGNEFSFGAGIKIIDIKF